MDKRTKTILAIITVAVPTLVGLLTIYYDYLPEMVWHEQAIYTGANSCIPPQKADACPPSLNSGQVSYFFLSNIGGVPATFYVNFSSNAVNISDPYADSWIVNPKQNVSYGFIPTFSNTIKTFSFQANATCYAEALLCRNNQKLSITCHYKIVNNSEALLST